MELWYRMAAVFAAVGAALLHINEATTVGMARSELRYQAELRAMSLEHAVQIITTRLNHSAGDVLLQLGREQHTQHRLRAKAAPSGQYSDGTKNAMVRLNSMMLETIVKQDELEIECNDFWGRLSAQIDELSADRDYFQTLVTQYQQKQQEADNQKEWYTEQIPMVQHELEEHNSQCTVEQADLHSQLRVVISDSQVMDKILNMTDCNDEAYEKADKNAASLLQCVNTQTGRQYTKLRANNAELRAEFGKLRHPKSVEVINSVVLASPQSTALLQVGHTHQRRAQQRQRQRQSSISADVPQEMTESPPSAPQMGLVPEERCTISNSSKCPELRERFVNIAGGIEDAREELEEMISNKQIRCQQIREQLQAEQEHLNFWHGTYQTRHAQAVARLGESRTQSNNLESNRVNRMSERDAKAESCKKTLTEMKSELCALRKIRGELLAMSNLPNEVGDCEVTSWDAEVCSKTCGGGTQALHRSMNMPAGAGANGWERGHDCPVMAAQRECNQDRCPVDCALSDWSEWTRCTVTCGGGVSERSRDILVHPTPHGNACDALVEQDMCNSGDCDRDCELSDWSDWSSTCTKMCGGGQLTRTKKLVTTQVGDGTCASFYDQSRFQVKSCNTNQCSYTARAKTCFSKVDVILVLDSSGSLGSDGFTAVKKTGAAFARAMGSDVRIGAMFFSGPPSTCERKLCLGQALPSWCASYEGRKLTPTECGIEQVSQLSSDSADVASKVEATAWQAQNTLTSQALFAAQVEMGNSRPGVPTVVVVVTDGFPYSHVHTRKAAESLKTAGARLLIVPVGSAVADVSTFEELASYPAKDNVVFAKDFDALTESNQTLNEVIADFCTNFA